MRNVEVRHEKDSIPQKLNWDEYDSFPNLKELIDSGYLMVGAIQAIDESNKLYRKLIGFLENYNEISYTVIVVPKLPLDSLRNLDLIPYWEQKRGSWLDHFHLFIFKYPFLDPDKQPDYHDNHTILPCDVHAFHLTKSGPQFLDSTYCEDFNTLTNFETKVILDV